MATLHELKVELRRKATELGSSHLQPLSASQYAAGFEILAQSQGAKAIYQDFITPQLSSVIADLLKSRVQISVLEIGPGPRSVLGYLPRWMRERVGNYTAFEPNELFASELEKWLSPTDTECVFPRLDSPPSIKRVKFSPDTAKPDVAADRQPLLFDVVLFCHSLYGMKPKRNAMDCARPFLKQGDRGGAIVVFHQDGPLDFGDLACSRYASFPSGVVDVIYNPRDNSALAAFASFIAGSAINGNELLRHEWCRTCLYVSSQRDESRPDLLWFSAPSVMLTFTHGSTRVSELTAQMPSFVIDDPRIKSAMARKHRPAGIMQPTEIKHVQECARWAKQHDIGLTIVGGSHSGHCVLPSVLAVDMGAFDSVDIVPVKSSPRALLVAGAGCKTGDIIRKAMEVGMTVPLAARSSVGVGSWLQGGIGHLSTLHGLSCDAVVGVIFVSVASAKVICVGDVPEQHRPAGAHTPPDADEVLWAMKGAGTNLGIVLGVVFRAYMAPIFQVYTWTFHVKDNTEAQRLMRSFDAVVASKLPQNCSAGLYLYHTKDEYEIDSKLKFGISVFESTEGGSDPLALSLFDNTVLGPPLATTTVNSIELFEMNLSTMHGEYRGGKTSSFRRCLFLKDLGATGNQLLASVRNAVLPTHLCYIHLLQGGGKIRDLENDDTAFDCRDWDFACVIAGIWPSDEDSTKLSRDCVDWVYQTVADLLPFSCGVYGADLGPDPRDAELAAKAFGPHRERLARIKGDLDPANVLAYACPLPKPWMKQKLIFLVTGERDAGKDYCAALWVDALDNRHTNFSIVRAASISDATKRAFAESIGAQLEDLSEHAFKEQHRYALSKFFKDQWLRRPKLREENFLDVVNQARNADVLFITEMSDPTPVASFSHLVPDWSRCVLRRVRGFGTLDDDGFRMKTAKAAASMETAALQISSSTTIRMGRSCWENSAENNFLYSLHTTSLDGVSLPGSPASRTSPEQAWSFAMSSVLHN